MQQRIFRRAGQLMVLVVLGALAAGPALAQGRGHDDQGRGQGRGNDQRSNEKMRVEQRQGDRDGGDRRAQARFDDRQRQKIYEYYDTEMRRGRCPPGLAKKQNGCQPPGQARRYTIGRPLPHDVIFYNVPQQIVVNLGPPPRGYRYVRVSNDILMLAIGTGIVVDALQDLGRIR